jgi:hypothetical protein
MGKKEDDHNRGQEDGAKADFFDQLFHVIDPFTSEHYDKGFRHGVDTTLRNEPFGRRGEHFVQWGVNVSCRGVHVLCRWAEHPTPRQKAHRVYRHILRL